MLELIKYIITFVNQWANVFLILVGCSALIVFFFEKRDKARIAATLVKGEIDTIEKNISILKDDHQLGNISVYHSKQIIGENQWGNYKHILVKYLSKSELESIDRFFDNAEQIERARTDIIHSLNNAWEHASLVEHYVVGLYVKDNLDNNELIQKIQLFVNQYEPLDIVFTPKISISALMKYLDNFSMLSGTTGYHKIQKMSYEK
ncbi:MAG: hypothetical protein ACLU41_05645 [Anaerotignum lactatifermentans]